MKHLAAITEFLIGLKLVAPEQIDSWAETPKMILSGKSKGPGGLVLFRKRYTACITIERYPQRRYPADLILAHVAAWLMQNYDPADNENVDPEFEVEVLDAQTADIEVHIEFVEDVELLPDDAGPISWLGNNYRLADADIWIAEEGDVNSDAE